MFVANEPTAHLTWHFLDKLTLDRSVILEVSAPQELQVEPAIPRLRMAVLPDRDIISDHVRWQQRFHCPAIFKSTFAEAWLRRPVGSHRLFLVEVGGFLGDCLLWAGAVVGPGHMRALEVEPVAAATAEFTKSLNWAGLSEDVKVVTDAVGDGAEHVIAAAATTGGTAIANPNFNLGPRANSSNRGQNRAVRLRTLDEVLDVWDHLVTGAVIDLVRVKAAGSEALIVQGLVQHLRTARVKRLIVECNDVVARKVLNIFKELPRYRLDQDLLTKTASSFSIVVKYQLDR